MGDAVEARPECVRHHLPGPDPPGRQLTMDQIRSTVHLTDPLASVEADLLADEEETTLVVGRWSYLGSGWADEGETALATAAAARAREYAREKAAQRQQSGITPTAGRGDR